MGIITTERLTKILSETQAVISECNSRGVHGSVEVNSRLFENVLMELLRHRAAMLQGADGALTNEDTKRVDELVMWIKRLAHSLRKAKPDSKLQSDAMDYLSRKGLIGVEDILR